MYKDNQSNFAPEAEQMFEQKDGNSNDKFSKMVKNLNVTLEKEVGEEVCRKIKQDLVVVMSTFAHEKENEYDEKKKEEKKNRWIVIGVSFVALIIVIFLFEYFFPPKYIVTAILGLGSSVIAFIGESHSKIGREIAHIRGNKESITTGIVKAVKALVQMMKKASLLHLFLLLSGIILLGEFLGSVSIIERTYRFAIAGYIAAMSKNEDNLAEPQVDEETLALIMAECDEKTINMLQQADITMAELNEIIELSQSDYDLVFYLNWKDVDWSDKDQVYEVVWQLINEKRSMQMENVFDKDVNDGGAPQWLCDLVAKASKDEITAVSFSEIKSIRDVREDAFTQYPKKSLANLLSNDYQKLAIILYINGGEEDSIVYYYGQSILRDFECLQFAQNSNATVKDKLISIAQRYRDMVYTCPNMENLENALALAEAFENAAGQF